MMDADSSESEPRFISLRWRILLPVFTVALVATMIAVYATTTAAPAPATSASALSADARLQFIRLLMSALSSVVVIIVFLAANWLVGQIERVSRVLEALAAGDREARTGMAATNEITALGAALDRYADSVQSQHDSLRHTLRRQRREVAHLTAVLEALPDGVVVQDLDGHVVLMNDTARDLLGAEEGVTDAKLKYLTALSTGSVGPALAPGVYTLGDPRRVERGGKVLSAQAAVVLSMANKRVGTVIILRDITTEVQREQARERLMGQLAQDVHAPMADLSRATMAGGRPSLNVFSREMARHAVALQKLIVEMRELNADFDRTRFNREQRALPLDEIVDAIANEWRSSAHAAGLTLDVIIRQPNMFVLGDERRLRWALGNLIDNAIKYTPSGGTLTLEARGERGGKARLRVVDTGVGIAADELPHVFARYYRGTPRTASGQMLQVPGTGQGLTIAREIVEAHGGSVSIKSDVGIGTTVAFTLPLTSATSLPLASRLPVNVETIDDDEIEVPLTPRVDPSANGTSPSSNGNGTKPSSNGHN